MNNKIAVIGLGNFGAQIAKELAKLGFIIIAIDKDREPVEKIQTLVSTALILDTSQEEVRQELNWEEIDIAIVAIGDPNTEDSIMTVALLKEFGVRQIIARAGTEIHEKILLKVGADSVVNPERDYAKILVEKVANPNIIDLRHCDENTVIGEFLPPLHFLNKNIRELDLRKKYHISVIALKRGANEAGIRKPVLLANPSPEEIIRKGDILVTIGNKADLDLVSRM